jgi:hypothetical protein
MLPFPEAFVKKIALQKYIDSKRPLFPTSPRDWRVDVNDWNSLNETMKQPWYEKSEQWLTDWAEKTPNSVQFVVENWVDVDFSTTP